MYIAKVMQRTETSEEFCLREFKNSSFDEAEDRACEYINDRDLDNEHPESGFFVVMEKVGGPW